MLGHSFFHRVWPDSTSKVVGKAQGFIIPVEQFGQSEFNVMYLTFDSPDHSGSPSVPAKEVGQKGSRGFKVVGVGGTGSSAFARGVAVFSQTNRQPSEVDASYHACETPA